MFLILDVTLLVVFDVIDTLDRSHSVGNCCYPKETREQVIEYFKGCWSKDVEPDEFGEIHKMPEMDVFCEVK